MTSPLVSTSRTSVVDTMRSGYAHLPHRVRQKKRMPDFLATARIRSRNAAGSLMPTHIVASTSHARQGLQRHFRPPPATGLARSVTRSRERGTLEPKSPISTRPNRFRIVRIVYTSPISPGDHRDPELIEHTVEELVAQRVYGLAWATKTSTTTTSCGTIRCWRCWSGKSRPDGRGPAAPAGPGQGRWPARARSTGWS